MDQDRIAHREHYTTSGLSLRPPGTGDESCTHFPLTTRLWDGEVLRACITALETVGGRVLLSQRFNVLQENPSDDKS